MGAQNQPSAAVVQATAMLFQATVEEQTIVDKGYEAATKARETARKANDSARQACNRRVSELQSALNKTLKDIDKEAEKAYKDKLVELGLNAEAYPMKTAMKAVDEKITTPALNGVGIAAGTVAKGAVGLWDRIGSGVKKAMSK